MVDEDISQGGEAQDFSVVLVGDATYQPKVDLLFSKVLFH